MPRSSSRLFHNAMRVSGWGHSWGNLMMEVCKACPKWPKVVESIHALVGFFRNRTWRKHVKRIAAHADFDAANFNVFRASTAKWRWETYVTCMGELLRFRPIVGLLQDCHFPNAQDKETIKKVLRACHDDELWIFSRLRIRSSCLSANSPGIGEWSARAKRIRRCARTRSPIQSTFLVFGMGGGCIKRGSSWTT